MLVCIGNDKGNLVLKQIYMKEKASIQMDTAVNSPTRRSHDKLDATYTNKSHFQLYSTRPSTVRLSETEQEIYSHSLIKQVMEASKLKSVQHDINRIDEDISLYARPLEFGRDEFKFDSIPSQNKMYSSECYAKIKQIKEGLRQSQNYKAGPPSRKSTQTASSRAQSVTSRISTKNPKVAVTGLASYNFKTVRAGNSLGFNKINHQQTLIEQIAQASRRKCCSIDRRGKILSKTSGRRFQKAMKNEQAILKDFSTATEGYLCDIARQSQENTLIYNERLKKLIFIKEYMEQEKVSYEEAAFIVNEIEGKGKKKVPVVAKPKQGETNDQALLEGRRMPAKRKPLQVRQFCFIQ